MHCLKSFAANNCRYITYILVCCRSHLHALTHIHTHTHRHTCLCFCVYVSPWLSSKKLVMWNILRVSVDLSCCSTKELIIVTNHFIFGYFKITVSMQKGWPSNVAKHIAADAIHCIDVDIKMRWTLMITWNVNRSNSFN